MSPVDDDQNMRALENTEELLLTGRPVPAAESGLAGFVAELRATADEPAPRPSAALSALLRDGLAPAPVTVRAAVPARSVGVSAWRHPWRSFAGLGLAVKIVLGAGVAVASVGGAATIDAVPDVVQRPARAVVDSVTGLFAPAAAVREPAAPAVPTPTAPAPAETPSGADPGAPDDAPAAGLPALSIPLPETTVPPLPPSGLPTDVPTAVPDVADLLRSVGDGSAVLPPDVVLPPPPVAP